MDFTRRMLMAPDDEGKGAGGGGEAESGGSAEQQSDKQPDPAAQMAEMQKRIEELGAQTKAAEARATAAYEVIERLNKPAEKQQENPEEETVLSQEMKPLLAAHREQILKDLNPLVGSLYDRIDRNEFLGVTAEVGADQSTIEESEKLYQTLLGRGLPATRRDALLMVLGRGTMDERRKARTARASAEEQRRQENSGAITERSGGRRGPQTLDISKLPPQKQLEAMEKALDGQEF